METELLKQHLFYSAIIFIMAGLFYMIYRLYKNTKKIKPEYFIIHSTGGQYVKGNYYILSEKKDFIKVCPVDNKGVIFNIQKSDIEVQKIENESEKNLSK